MNTRTTQAKQAQSTATSTDHSAKRDGAAATPPRYGIDFLDRQRGQPNRTGLPDRLKAGVEGLSGLSLDNVRVHYDSSRPAQLQALAYTQGTDIHVGPGQERHLAHEAWHVVQQAQGRVRPTVQMKGGVPVNDDATLEREADVMGERATRAPSTGRAAAVAPMTAMASIQRYTVIEGGDTPLKLSAGKQIALFDDKTLYAAPDLIADANERLEEAGAYVTLTVDRSDVVKVRGSEFLAKVGLTWAADRAPERGYHKKLGDKNSQVAEYCSHADCHRNAQTVMGSDSQGVYNTEQVVLTPNYLEHLETEELDLPTSAQAREKNLSGAHANRGVYAFFQYALPIFADFLAVYNSGKYGDLIAGIRKIDVKDLGVKFRNDASRVYREIQKSDNLSYLFAAKFGINQFVVPKVGHALTQVNDETERSESDKDLWNFHWAGIILVDDDDYVTLENLSVENEDVINSKWFFRMYGAKEQSFHKANSSDAHVGQFPITLGFRSAPS